MAVPSIFDWFERLAFARGQPAAAIVLGTAVVIVLAWDWRLALFALAVQYFAAGLLFVDILDPRLAIVKLFAGYFACLILYFTARQVNWGRPPADSGREETFQAGRNRVRRWGRLKVPGDLPLRLLLTALLLGAVVYLAFGQQFRIPILPEELAHVGVAALGLASFGLLAMTITIAPFQAGTGILMFLTGFELLYNVLDQSAGVMAALAATNLVVALTIAYLMQAWQASPTSLDA